METAIRDSFLTLDKELLRILKIRRRRDGSCCVCAVLVDNVLYVANVGDSRAVLCKEDKAVDVSSDHKPNREDETKRVEQAGGLVVNSQGTFRVRRPIDPNLRKRNATPQVLLAVSRAFGDRELKVPTEIVTANPEIYRIPLEKGKAQALVLACDGVWDVLTSQEAVDLARPLLDTPKDAAAAIVRTAYDKGSEDNISVVTVAFTWS